MTLSPLRPGTTPGSDPATAAPAVLVQDASLPRGLVLGAVDPDRLALIGPDRSAMSHGELAARVAERAAAWGPSRRLVLVEGANTVEQVVSYLAALEYSHVALVVPTGRDHTELLATYSPDIVATGDTWTAHRTDSAHALHPDLSLLLSTSGSTGSPKLVRLGAEGVQSNARAIADYLGLTADDVALTSLPLHYCYGLSVLHSHLLVGGAVALTDTSVVDDCFWSLAQEAGVTSLAGVPHTFDLLEASGFEGRDLPHLRRITQAGGRLEPAAVTRFAELGRRRGWDLVVMYGQTEATARMAWLPPHLAASHPHSIGRAIPGGELRIEPVPGAPEGTGELVYRGPNVMFGYAHGPADLARGREVHELRTGDLAREQDGLVEVLGRTDRHAKVFGLRVDLDRVERHLATLGHRATVVAGPTRLHLALPHGRRAAEARTEAARWCGLPESAVRSTVLPDLPRTPSGKVDALALAPLLLDDPAESSVPADPEGPTPHSSAVDGPDEHGSDREPVDEVRAVVARVLGRPDVRGQDSFVGLGGDSLSYVEVVTRLESLPGVRIRPGWHQRPLADLVTATDGPETGPGADSARGWWRRRPTLRPTDPVVALRALAILIIVASHVDLVDWTGGAHLLLALAGYNTARFQLSSPLRGERLRALASGAAQLLVVAVPFAAGVALLSGRYDWSTVAMLNSVLGSDRWDDQWQFWFLEVLLGLTLATAALVAVPILHRWELRHPFVMAMGLVAVTAAVRFTWVGLEAGPHTRYTIGGTAFFFLLGWAGARAASLRQRLVVLAATAALVPGFFGDPWREGVVLVGLGVLLLVPQVLLPGWLARVAAVLAGASLAVYVTHWQVYPPLEDAGLPWLGLAASLLVGIAWARVTRPWQRWAAGRVRILCTGRAAGEIPLTPQEAPEVAAAVAVRRPTAK